MRKYVKLLLILAVAGAAIACENEFIPKEPIEGPKPDVQNDIVGLWVKEIYMDTQQGLEQGEVTYRFENDATGYITSDMYDEYGALVNMSRAGFTYEFTEEQIRIIWSQESEIMEVECSVEADLLTMYNVDGKGANSVFIKRADADRRFIGDWSTTRKDDEFYYDDHIKFVTPTDCFTYSSKYDNLMAAPIEGPSYPVWYKYTFDGDMLHMTVATNKNSAPISKYYRFAGDKLYLSGSKDGIETCYSTIKK